MSELRSMTVRAPPSGSVGIGVEGDLYFKLSHSLSIYAKAARQNGAISDNPRLLDATQDHPSTAAQAYC